jgi:hypothetical protein
MSDKPVCKRGREFAFVIHGYEVKIIAAPAEEDDPFACFTEWASEADRKGYDWSPSSCAE